MFTSKKIMLSNNRQPVCAGLFLLIAVLLNGISLSGQTRQTVGLAQDGNSYRLGQTSHNNLPKKDWNPSSVVYYDILVPQPGAMPYLSLAARGGDGGKYEIKDVLGHTVRTGQGGQGALVKALFKIGTGTNELKPGSTLRVIVGQSGRSSHNNWGSLGNDSGGGGGGTGILYLPAGANGNNTSNWQILAVAGGGGGGNAGTGGEATNGLPGEITENGFINSALPGVFTDMGQNGHGGASWDEFTKRVGGGGGTSTDGKGQGHYVDGTPIKCAGKCGFQGVNGVLLPIGGAGGDEYANYGGYGFGGGGGSGNGGSWVQTPGGGGGGYSGGYSGVNKEYRDNSLGGGGGGSYLNPAIMLPGTGVKNKNSATNDPGNGYVEYQFFATNPVVTRDLGFEYHKGTESSILNMGNWTLKWQYDGNLVLYQAGVAKWASNTQNKGTDLYFQGDGNLVIYQSGNPVWNSGTDAPHQGGKGGRKLVLTSEGSLFIIDQDSKVIWAGH
ncbi:MAG: hypothetical protein H6574_20820 [Lewinellaceae bacterium]|nr:hypothetical protein [Lewinellaceae bacterium]